MSASTATAGLPVRTPRNTVFHNHASSPVDWFAEHSETGDETDYADVWIDHHRVAHERHPTRDGMTHCGTRILGSDAPTHARISAVGCHLCAAANAHSP
ncbi:hypothetical protein [Saccharopolyspora sp. NPDC050642]|uniref:hypothetical protein n=1 Tax=Saccharopolyspora sp. NPDC050642 TaxID=3157099 RepID=UPI0033F0A9E4